MKLILEMPIGDFALHDVTPGETAYLYKKQFTSTIAARGKRKMFREWREDGLIPAIGDDWSCFDHNAPLPNKHQEWIWLNFYEMVWTRLVDELRHFNYPKSKIKEFAEGILRKLPPQTIKMIQEQYNASNVKRDLRKKYDELCRQENRQPMDEEFTKDLNKILTAISNTTLFEYIIGSVVFARTPLLFYVTKCSGILPYTPLAPMALEPEDETYIKKALSDSHITISFLSLIDDFLLDDPHQKLLGLRNFLTDQERKIIDLLRSKQLKELTIKCDTKTEKIFKAEVVTSEVLNMKSDVRRIVEAIRSGEHKKVHFTYVNSDSVYIEKEEIIKL